MPEACAGFESPRRRERLELLLHLLANAETVPCVRGPGGAGKTRMLDRLGERLVRDWRVVRLSGRGGPLRDQLAARLELDQVDRDWPAAVRDAAEPRPLALLIDDAEHLQPADLADLFELIDSRVRAVCAMGAALPPTADAAAFQFIDLPPFGQNETRDFLTACLGRVLDEPVVAALHRASGGWPGALLEAAASLRETGGGSGASSTRMPVLAAVGAALVIAAAVAAWLYRDDLREGLGLTDGDAAAPASPAVVEDAGLAAGAAADTAPLEHDASAAPPEGRLPTSSVTPAATDPEAPGADADGSAEADPLLDAVIDEAIRAAAQPESGLRTEDGARATPAGDAAGARTRKDTDEEPDPVLAEVMAAVERATAEKADPPKASGGAPAQEAGTPPARPEDRPAKVEAPGDGTSGQTADRSTVRKGGDGAPAPKERAAPERDRRPGGTQGAPRPRGGPDWLRAQPGTHWTLQLAGARDRASLERFVRRHRIGAPHAIFERELEGRPWYSLVAGSYPSREAAIAARARLPRGIASAGVWPRTFASIREQMTQRR